MMVYQTRGHIKHQSLVRILGNMFGYSIEQAGQQVARAANNTSSFVTLQQSKNITYDGWFANTFDIACCPDHEEGCYLIRQKHEANDGLVFWYANLDIFPVDFLLECEKHKKFPKYTGILNLGGLAFIINHYCVRPEPVEEIHNTLIQHIWANKEIVYRVTDTLQLRVIPESLVVNSEQLQLSKQFLLVKSKEEHLEKPFLLIRMEHPKGFHLGSAREKLTFSIDLEKLRLSLLTNMNIKKK